jgi:hypothetical protein
MDDSWKVHADLWALPTHQTAETRHEGWVTRFFRTLCLQVKQYKSRVTRARTEAGWKNSLYRTSIGFRGVIPQF